MTLAQFAMIFWHDLAAPILAGIITAAIVGWQRLSAGGVTGSKVKTGRQAAVMAICARNRPQG